MIVGSCPYDCGGHLWLSIAEAPAIQRHDCDECGRTIWTYHSRLNPWSMTDEDFRAEYDVDDESKSVRKREPA